eukprot:6733167-Ditylum_brightwellii.AAC.1
MELGAETSVTLGTSKKASDRSCGTIRRGGSAVVTIEWRKGIGGRGTDSKWEDHHFPGGSDV